MESLVVVGYRKCRIVDHFRREHPSADHVASTISRIARRLSEQMSCVERLHMIPRMHPTSPRLYLAHTRPVFTTLHLPATARRDWQFSYSALSRRPGKMGESDALVRLITTTPYSYTQPAALGPRGAQAAPLHSAGGYFSPCAQDRDWVLHPMEVS